MAQEDGPSHREDLTRLLVAGPPYRGYTRTVARAFERCGASVTAMEWDLLGRNLVQDTLFYTSARYRQRLGETQLRKNTRDLETKVMKTKPTHVLVLMSAILSKETVRFCRDNGIALAMWAYDSVRAFPVIAEAAPAYDLVYTYEPTEVDTLRSLAKIAFLPMAFDDETYRPDPGAPKPYDVCFVGSLRDVPTRKATLRALADGLPEARVGVWTDSVHWYSPRRMRDWRLRLGRPNLEINARTVTHAEINRIYVGSKVCLNIHMGQSIGAPNPRNFEILGSGGTLLTDRDLSVLEGYESGKGFVRYTDSTSMRERAKELTEDEELRKRVAEAGHSIAASRHTYVHRAKRILEDFGRL